MTDPLVRRLIRAGHQRLEAADILFRAEKNLDAMYLAGYAVECGLKAALLARTPKSRRSSVERQAFQGKSGHDFEKLKSLLRQQRLNFPLDINREFRGVSTWTTELRYDVGRKPAEDAEAFINAARNILRWLEQQL